jgi:hypothetical protein
VAAAITVDVTAHRDHPVGVALGHLAPVPVHRLTQRQPGAADPPVPDLPIGGGAVAFMPGQLLERGDMIVGETLDLAGPLVVPAYVGADRGAVHRCHSCRHGAGAAPSSSVIPLTRLRQSSPCAVPGPVASRRRRSGHGSVPAAVPPRPAPPASVAIAGPVPVAWPCTRVAGGTGVARPSRLRIVTKPGSVPSCAQSRACKPAGKWAQDYVDQPTPGASAAVLSGARQASPRRTDSSSARIFSTAASP